MQRPAPGELQVLYADPDAVAAEHARALYLPRLSESERTQHARFRFDEDRHTYLIAHALVRTVLGGMLGVEPGALEFAIGEHGKPELASPAGTELRFNLSHTRGLVACAFAHACDVGVDVEHVDRKTEIETLARSVLSPGERSVLRELPGLAQRERFFRYWTLKEAYVKAMGRGIALPLRSLHVELGSAGDVGVGDVGDVPTPRFVFHPPFEDDGREWWLATQSLLERHVLGVAIRSRTAPSLSVEPFVP